jgi:hypothetical protein
MNQTQHLTSEQEAIYDRVHDDFGEFCKELWLDRGYDKVAPITWVELDIMDWMSNGPPFRGTLAPRGLGKTYQSCALAAWRLLRDPDRKILIVSKSHSHAKKAISMLRQWMEIVWFLQHLRPNPEQVDSATQFQVGPARASLQPSVTAIGIDGMLEGNRAHTIIGDDVETDTNTETLESREGLNDRLGELKDILYPYNPKLTGAPIDRPEILYVGTYHHEESVYLKLAEPTRGYKFRTWTLEYPELDGGQHELAPKLREKLVNGDVQAGDLVFPLRFDRANVNQKKAEGFTRYAMQHMLVATLSDTNRYPLRLSDLIVMDVPPTEANISVAYGQRDHNGSTAIEGIETYGFQGDRLYRPAILSKETKVYSGTKAGIDPAGRGDDRTGLSIVSHLAGNLWVKACMGLTGGADTEALDLIASTLRQHDCRDAYFEHNIDTFGTYEQLLNAALRRHFLEPGEDDRFPSGWKCSLTPVRGGMQKEVRIITTLEPVITGHRLIVDRKVVDADKGEPQHCRFQYQLTRITKQRKCLKEDGKLDSLEIAVRAWENTLGVNQAVVAERSRLEVQEEALRKMGVHRRPKEPARWFTLP